MAKADTSVKWFHSEMADAPVLSSVAGKAVELLDACLINGFSTRTPNSVVVSGGVATVSISAGNPYQKHAVISISGASDGALNSEWRIATSSATSFTFVCPGVADGTVTGSSIKRAPAGWGKPFSGANIAVYQSNNPISTQLYLRVSAETPGFAIVRGYEQMTDVSTGTSPFPTVAQVADLRWPFSGGQNWTVIADNSFMWVIVKGSVAPLLNHFGDIVPFSSNDKYHCTINGVNGNSTNGAYHPATGGSNSSTVPRVWARGISQAAGPITSYVLESFATGSSRWCGQALGSASLDGNIRLGAPVYAYVDGSNTSNLRGILPGAISTLESPNLFDKNVYEIGEKAYLAVEAVVTQNSTGVGVCLFDILGPWR